MNSDGTEDADLIAPVITILGDATTTIEIESVYTDKGATAVDVIDGDVTNTITASSTVDTHYSGVYSVIYKANDSSNNVVYATRMVIVKSRLVHPLLRPRRSPIRPPHPAPSSAPFIILNSI